MSVRLASPLFLPVPAHLTTGTSADLLALPNLNKHHVQEAERKRRAESSSASRPLSSEPRATLTRACDSADAAQAKREKDLADRRKQKCALHLVPSNQTNLLTPGRRRQGGRGKEARGQAQEGAEGRAQGLAGDMRGTQCISLVRLQHRMRSCRRSSTSTSLLLPRFASCSEASSRTRRRRTTQRRERVTECTMHRVLFCLQGRESTDLPPPPGLYLDRLLGLCEARHVIQRVEQRARRPRLGPARVVAVAAVLVGELGQARPRVGRDVGAVPRQVLVDVVERRRRVVLARADERVKDEVRTEEVPCAVEGETKSAPAT